MSGHLTQFEREYLAAVPAKARQRLLQAALHQESLWLVHTLILAVLSTLAMLGFVFAQWAGLMLGLAAGVVLIMPYQHRAEQWVLHRYFARQKLAGRLRRCPQCLYDQQGSCDAYCAECGCPVRIEPVGGDSAR